MINIKKIFIKVHFLWGLFSFRNISEASSWQIFTYRLNAFSLRWPVTFMMR